MTNIDLAFSVLARYDLKKKKTVSKNRLKREGLKMEFDLIL